MSNYSNTKATIAANVYTNHNNEVTAALVKTGINAVVDTLIAGGFLYKGVATTSTNPGSPDANVFYIATATGTYTNFGSLVVADGEVAILKYNGSWSKEVTGAATSAQVSALGHKVDYDLGVETPASSAINGSSLDQYGVLKTNTYTTQRGVSNFIKVSAGDTIHIVSGAYQGGSNAYSFAAFYSTAAESGFISSEIYTSYGTEVANYDIVVPAGAEYMRLVLMDYENPVKYYNKNGIDGIISSIYALVGAALPLDSELSNSSTKGVENSAIKKYIDGVTGYPIDKAPSKNNGYSLNPSGKLFSNSYTTARGVTDFLSVVGGSKIYIKSGVYQGGSNNYIAVAFYSAADEANFISGIIGPNYGQEVTDRYCDVPSTASYARFVLMDYNTPAIIGSGAEKTISERIQEIKTIKKNYGKSIAVFGGSHTVRPESETAKDLWRGLLDMSVFSAGVGSTGMVSYVNMGAWQYGGVNVFTRIDYNDGVGSFVWDKNGYLSQYKITAQTPTTITLSDGNTYTRNSADDYEANIQLAVKRLSDASAIDKDIYLLWISTNDYTQAQALGSYTDYTAADNYDTSKIFQSSSAKGTVCGGFNRTIKLIREANPTAEIYVFTSLRFFDQNAAGYDPFTTDKISTNTLNFYDYQKEICKAAQVAGCAVLDQFLLQGIDSLNYATYYQSDKLHLKTSGYEKIGYLQADFLANGR